MKTARRNPRRFHIRGVMPKVLLARQIATARVRFRAWERYQLGAGDRRSQLLPHLGVKAEHPVIDQTIAAFEQERIPLLLENLTHDVEPRSEAAERARGQAAGVLPHEIRERQRLGVSVQTPQRLGAHQNELFVDNDWQWRRWSGYVQEYYVGDRRAVRQRFRERRILLDLRETQIAGIRLTQDLRIGANHRAVEVYVQEIARRGAIRVVDADPEVGRHRAVEGGVQRGERGVQLRSVDRVTRRLEASEPTINVDLRCQRPIELQKAGRIGEACKSRRKREGECRSRSLQVRCCAVKQRRYVG